jgi:hypothetical protein
MHGMTSPSCQATIIRVYVRAHPVLRGIFPVYSLTGNTAYFDVTSEACATPDCPKFIGLRLFPG